MKTEQVFIVGCARSGSTLLRTILNRSPKVAIPPETHFLRRISEVGKDRWIKKFGDLQQDSNLCGLADLLYRRRCKWLKGLIGVEREAFYRRLAQTDRSERSIFLTLLELYGEKTKGTPPGELLLGEKTPTHLYYVPTLVSWFPEAKIIHTFRDPRGVFMSRLVRVKSGRWGLQGKYPSLPDWLIKPVLSPLEIHLTAKCWRDAVKLHHRYRQMYHGRYLLQRFEDLVSQPETNVRRICTFLGIDYQPAMVDDMVVVRSSFHQREHQPGGFEKTAIDRWKTLIHPAAKAWLTLLTRKELGQFGYLP